MKSLREHAKSLARQDSVSSRRNAQRESTIKESAGFDAEDRIDIDPEREPTTRNHTFYKFDHSSQSDDRRLHLEEGEQLVFCNKTQRVFLLQDIRAPSNRAQRELWDKSSSQTHQDHQQVYPSQSYAHQCASQGYQASSSRQPTSFATQTNPVARRHPAKNPQIESSGTAAKRRSEAERRSNNPTVPRGLHPHPVLPTSHLLNAEELRQALRIIGEHLGNRRQRIYIVALGGLVNCVLLGSRAATKDIDWFNHFLSNDQWDQLNAAIVPACNADPKIITRTFKDHALNSIDLATLERIVWEALTQKTTVFHHGGLYVYAAPWIYQIIAKMERLGALNPNDVPNSYDLHDAIAYLRAHLKRNSLNPRPAVSWKYLWRECNSYRILSKYKDRYEICLELAQQINNGFREKWGFYGIRDLPEPSSNARIAELPGDFP